MTKERLLELEDNAHQTCFSGRFNYSHVLEMILEIERLQQRLNEYADAPYCENCKR